MALPQGIDFRETAGYVSDPSNYDYNIESRLVYPWTTAQGNNVGWEVISAGVMNYRDRNSSNDARIAGINFHQLNITADFRIDLPSAGNMLVGLGVGDPSYACPVPVDLYDTSSSLGSLSTGSTSGSQKFKDATDTEYTNVTWPTSQTLAGKTFATTICRFSLIGNAGASRICSVYVEAGAAPAPTLTDITPNSGAQGDVVAITLTGTNFVDGSTTINISPTGITPSGIDVVSATSLTATFTISAVATIGLYGVTVTTPDGTSNSVSFEVTAAPTPPSGASDCELLLLKILG